MKSKSTIEVNGKRYDAVTGAVIGIATAPQLRTAGRNIDGFFRARGTVAPAVQKPSTPNSIAELATLRPAAASEPKASAPQLPSAHGINHARAHAPQTARQRSIRVNQMNEQVHKLSVRRNLPNHTRHHMTARSQTLRRDAVPPPQTSTHNTLKPKGALQHSVPGSSLINAKKSATNIDSGRWARARQVAKSSMIAHHAVAPRSILPSITAVAVQPPPARPLNNNDAPAVPPPQLTNKPTDIFEHALANATNFVDMQSHKARYRHKARTHLVSMTAGSMALIIIAAFVAYQDNPAMQLKLAGLKAGISANMPNFAAAGFTYNGVRAGDGKLMFGLKGKSGTYQLTQTDTNLSDSDMIQTIGATTASGAPTYSVTQAGDITVYRLTNTNATWVSDGSWYTLNGTGSLSNSQVASLVEHV